jgi:hypothetical protein
VPWNGCDTENWCTDPRYPVGGIDQAFPAPKADFFAAAPFSGQNV